MDSATPEFEEVTAPLPVVLLFSVLLRFQFLISTLASSNVSWLVTIRSAFIHRSWTDEDYFQEELICNNKTSYKANVAWTINELYGFKEGIRHILLITLCYIYSCLSCCVFFTSEISLILRQLSTINMK